MRTVFWGGYFKGKENIMTEIEFLKLYKNKRKLKSIKEAKEKLEIFWDIIFTGIALEKKVTVKDFGTFEVKKLKSRKIYNIHKNSLYMTKERTALKFRVKNEFMKIVNKKVSSCNLTDETGIK